MNVKYVMAIVAISLFFLSAGVMAAEQSKQPTVAELKQAEAEAIVVRNYLQNQLDAWTQRLVRVQDARAAAQAKEKAPVKKEEKKQ